ncbi:hypothetical protein PSEUBRA_006094 [Kalmanozyma brasiliensis GHG001]|uniref:Uncharacterized protein n=1 Tax=Kalmanozyma brasiliensis (strain GHG001) TaxID=1365824 RepID=V5EJ84_KALBG|nr:uncharacterized protein PSEUBRA_006094 [Kalmanozyma brasiliensis GHG001]EST04795.1 hypothetical protein PSEUBRA_006094 [Kalmanozyma brasiliensis GHG001]
MLTNKTCILFLLLSAAVFVADCHALTSKRSVPLNSRAAKKRNIGGQLKDWYLSGMTKNYMCTDTGRLVPVDPETGHMLLKGLRKRSNWFDDLLGHSHATEKGLCRNPTWVLPPGWTQPIPVKQFNAQYPWDTVDDRGQIRLKDDFRSWLEERAAAGAAMGSSQAQGGAGGAAPNGGSGSLPASEMKVASGTGTGSGFGETTFGNGVAAGAAAHV